jgi:hypothetical protein
VGRRTKSRRRREQGHPAKIAERRIKTRHWSSWPVRWQVQTPEQFETALDAEKLAALRELIPSIDVVEAMRLGDHFGDVLRALADAGHISIQEEEHGLVFPDRAEDELGEWVLETAGY